MRINDSDGLSGTLQNHYTAKENADRGFATMKWYGTQARKK